MIHSHMWIWIFLALLVVRMKAQEWREDEEVADEETTDASGLDTTETLETASAWGGIWSPEEVESTKNFVDSPGVREFLLGKENHEFIKDLLAVHRIYKSKMKDESKEREKRASDELEKPAKVHINESFVKGFSELRPYSFKEQVLRRHRSPVGIMNDAIQVSMTLIKITYLSYCTSGAIYGDILTKKCISALTMLEPHRIGDLKQFGFTQEELDQLMPTNVVKT